MSSSDASLLGIDRDAEHVNTAAAAAAGVGAEVVDYRPDLGLLVITFLPGVALANESFADPGVMARSAHACRLLHAGPAFTGVFDMFTRQAGYLATVLNNGFPLPAGYERFTDDFADVGRALAASPAPLVPCNNDLLAGNYLDNGERVWLIDYEYSGMNDACFELGNTATECEFTLEMTEAWTEAYFGDLRPERPRPRAPPVAVQRVRLGAVGLHPGRLQPDRLRLPLVGHAPLREGGAHVLRTRLQTTPRGGQRPWLSFRPAPRWSSSGAG